MWKNIPVALHSQGFSLLVQLASEAVQSLVECKDSRRAKRGRESEGQVGQSGFLGFMLLLL